MTSVLNPIQGNVSGGQDLLQRLYYFDKNGELDGGSATQIVANIVAFGFASASATCDAGMEIVQEVDFECSDTAKGDAVRSNANCLACKAQVQKVMNDRVNLDALAASKNPNYIPPVANPDLVADIKGLLADGSDGACKYVCMQCVVMDFTQTLQVRVVENCDMSTETFATAFASGMTQAAADQLNQYKAQLTKMGAQLSSPDAVSKASIQISDTIRDITKTTTLSQLHSQVLAAQKMAINKDSTSVVIQNVKQAITIDMLASMAAQIYNDTNVTAAIQYNAHEGSINNEYKLRNLADSLIASIDTMEDAMSDAVVRIAIILVVLLIIMVLIFAALFFFKPSILFGGLTETEISVQPSGASKGTSQT
jgi:hypothetical protein